MTARNPIATFAAPGLVGLMVDVDTAVAIADSVEFAVASGGVTTVGRPLGLHDVEAIRTAAAQAAAEADPDVPVILGAVPSRPDLRLVGGEDQ
ncbi:hypothetical protein [Nocardioides aquiterrae]|uniref:Uncharacterized protein n=1 Tax=Nocardioides aquiterrae TaxID=203799 RepID=A0ABN1UCZ2_9ACTN